MVTPQRLQEVRSVIAKVGGWAAGHDDVRGIAVVGSWARGAARMDSDIDVVVLTDAAGYADAGVWAPVLDGQLIRRQRWGPLEEVRLALPSGLEVEIGVAPVSWAATDPVDAGTYRVMRDGHRIVHDPDGVLAALSAACRPGEVTGGRV